MPSDPEQLPPLTRLAALYAARFPDAGTPSRETDRQLLQDNRITEPALAALYSEAYSVPVLPEDEIRPPEPYPNGSMDFFNANSDGGNIAESMLAIPELAEEFSSLIQQNLMRDDLQYGQKEMWRRLGYLPQYVRLFSACFRLRAEGKDASEAFAEFRSFVTEHELELQKALDAYRLLKLSREYAGFENRS